MAWILKKGDSPSTQPSTFGSEKKQRFYLFRILDRYYDYVHLGPPCSSFSVARTPPVRTSVFIHGLPDLSEKDRAKVREGNALCYFSCRCLEAATSAGIVSSLEQPWSSFMWKMPCLKKITTRATSYRMRTDFCAWGEPWQKRTGILFIHCQPVSLGKICPGCRHHQVLRGCGPGGGRLSASRCR